MLYSYKALLKAGAYVNLQTEDVCDCYLSLPLPPSPSLSPLSFLPSLSPSSICAPIPSLLPLPQEDKWVVFITQKRIIRIYGRDGMRVN